MLLILIILPILVFGAPGSDQGFRYVAVGDSYSIGEGISETGRWPNQLVERLRKEGVDIHLAANPSRTGWTTQDALEKELPVFKAARPDFATLLIGVNDWVQQVPADRFRSNLKTLMENMLEVLGDSGKMVVVTIPDFSVTPEGDKYSRGRDITAGLAEFNRIIAEEAAVLMLSVVDIFPLSQSLENQYDMVAADGLHPSAKAYTLWVDKIFPVVLKKLR